MTSAGDPRKTPTGTSGGQRPLVRRTVPLAAGILLTLASICYLVDMSMDNIRAAGGISALLNFDPLLLLASMAVLQLHFLAAAWSWKRVCEVSGGRLGLRKAYSIHFVSLLGKYIPGKVWAAVGKVGLSRQSGVSTASAGRGLVLETLFIVTCSLMVSLPLVPRISGKLGVDLALSMIAVGVVIFALLLTSHPGAHRRLTGLVKRLTGRDIACVDPGFSSVLKLIPVYLLVYLLLGLAFHLLALSFGVHLEFIPGIALMPTSVGVGFLVLLAPAGIGVSEVTLLWLMRLVVPAGEQEILPLLALASRLWMTLSELVAFSVAVSIWGGWKAMAGALSRERAGSMGGGAPGPASGECEPVDEDMRQAVGLHPVEGVLDGDDPPEDL
ncbi:MAG: lysylphosphatidylglycerol synthase domain-containing protein [Candidatus Fermentibacter sp.]|nr:lysylphosphatidylglycerol synthase domain-containing protein [Candidatus Fermentibacter sp.]